MSVEEPDAPTQDESEESDAGVALRERYGLVLLLLVSGYLLNGLSDSSLVRLAYTLVVLAILLVVLWSPGIPRQLRGLGVVGSALLALLVVIAVAADNEEAFAAALIVIAVLQLLAAAAIMYRIAQHDRVGFQTIMGAIAVYAMIGFAAGSVYRGLDIFQDFTLYDGITAYGDYLYFALITLTTVGYGDITPAADISKRFAEVEAFVGQIFLITLVARLVSLWGKPLRSES